MTDMAVPTTTTAKWRPSDLFLQSQPQLPAEGGVWLKQHTIPDPPVPVAVNDQHDHHPADDQYAQQRNEQQQRQSQQQQTQPQQQQQIQSQSQQPAQQTFVFYANSSSSDLTSPLTPTFSQHGSSHHLRCASSTSSLDLPTNSSTCSDSPVSPVLPSHNATVSSTNNTIRQLPDVQEDPLEREDDDDGDEPAVAGMAEECRDSVYDCLCDSPCIHQNSDLISSADWTLPGYNEVGSFDYDGFLSDSDSNPTMQPKKHRSGAESPLVGLTNRIGSRFPTLNRWKSTKRRARAFTAGSELSIDLPPALSRAASTSRSSSLSAPSRRFMDRSNEPPLPPTPALSSYEYGSTDSVAMSQALDIEKANVRKSIERDRAQATTPLLPPLLTNPPSIASQNQSPHPSPLQSPTVAPACPPELNSPAAYSTPPLSTKASFSSFRPPLMTSLSAPVVATSDISVTIPNLLEQHDAWSDRLGHANYTIIPKPYNPDTSDVETLRAFRSDWEQARINYTKHIVRTGEHYGTTSKTYGLTEAKWAETERQWKSAHEDLLKRVSGDWTEPEWCPNPAAIPRMLDDKFPDLGDEDIVGPMMRDAVMVRDPGFEGAEKHSAKKFFRDLAEKVGLRK